MDNEQTVTLMGTVMFEDTSFHWSAFKTSLVTNNIVLCNYKDIDRVRSMALVALRNVLLLLKVPKVEIF